MYRFVVPGVGPITVEASNVGEASRRMLQYLREQGITLEQGTSIPAPERINAAQVQVGDVFLRNEGPRLTNDDIDNAMNSGSGGSNSGDGGDTGDLGLEDLFNQGYTDVSATDGDIRNQTGQDIQAFPFASYANAVARRGLDTNGVLGSSISQAYNPLASVQQFGALTGTTSPIGNDPGSLEAYYNNNLGSQGRLAQETFNALRAGQVGSGFSPEALNPYLRPDIATSEGRGNATDVLDLARAAAVQRYGALTASQLLPSNERLLEGFQRPLAQGQQPDFLQYASSRFGV